MVTLGAQCPLHARKFSFEDGGCAEGERIRVYAVRDEDGELHGCSAGGYLYVFWLYQNPLDFVYAQLESAAISVSPRVASPSESVETPPSR